MSTFLAFGNIVMATYFAHEGYWDLAFGLGLLSIFWMFDRVVDVLRKGEK